MRAHKATHSLLVLDFIIFIGCAIILVAKQSTKGFLSGRQIRKNTIIHHSFWTFDHQLYAQRDSQ